MTSIENVISTRMCVRAYLKKQVPRELICKILDGASRAPSSSNTQPWRVYVLQGEELNSICKSVCLAYDNVAINPELLNHYRDENNSRQKQLISPYLERRRENGWGLYSLLGIKKGDKERMHMQHRKNFEFFGAPVGLFFTIDKNLSPSSLLDYGMFLQNLMLLARVDGLDTCPQAAWNDYSKIILSHIHATENERLVCGMALGYANQLDLINTFKTSRVPLEEFAVWL